jgi:hypothetical protein
MFLWRWQIFCVFLFLAAASLFSIIISQVNEILVGQSKLSKELDNTLEAYLAVQPRQADGLLIDLCEEHHINQDSGAFVKISKQDDAKTQIHFHYSIS